MIRKHKLPLVLLWLAVGLWNPQVAAPIGAVAIGFGCYVLIRRRVSA